VLARQRSDDGRFKRRNDQRLGRQAPRTQRRNEAADYPARVGEQHDADATTPGNAAWHRQLHHTGSHELSDDTAQTPGMRRYEAISGKRHGSRKLWMGKTVVAPGMASGDHHHGEAETGIYVVCGHPSFVFVEDAVERRIETGPGDYVYVPPYVPHREENPSPDEEAVVVIARTTQEGIVVNLPSLRTEVPELDRLAAELAAQSHGG
jgi:uncharacterized RmlC-like cupin family protein